MTMKPEDAGNIILDIFRRDCDKAGESLSNKKLHGEYFRKTDSALGFFEGVRYLVDHKWLAVNETEENCHQITKSGWKAGM
jgi:hypothetical protein